MIYRLSIFFSTIALAGLLFGCSGGTSSGGTSSLVGQVIDDPIDGLGYTCGATTGLTNKSGHFNYSPGSSCTFFIGNITLGRSVTVPSDGIVTPYEMVGATRLSTSHSSYKDAIALAQFLQSLNSETANGVLTISESVTSALSSASVPAQNLIGASGVLSQSQLQGLVTTATAGKKLLIDSGTASSRLNINLSEAGIKSASNASETTSCSLTSNPFPVASAGATPAPSNINTFYGAFYTAVNNASTATNPNPLKVTPAQATVGNNQYYAAAVAAFVWGLPVEQVWEKQAAYFASGTGTPINKIFLAQSIDTGTTIVSPNTSVLYANGFVDLSVNPYIVNYPQSSTYNVLQIMDAYTNVQASVGSRVSTCGSVVLYYANASYAPAVKAAYPNNSVAIYTPQAWLIGRVAVDAYAVPTLGGIPQTIYQTLFGTALSKLALWKSQSVLSQYKLTALTNYVNSGSVTQSNAYTYPAPTTSGTLVPNLTYSQFYSNLAGAVNKNGFLVNYAGSPTGTGVVNGVLNTSSNSTVYDQTNMFANFSSIGLTASGFNPPAAAVSFISNGYSNAQSAVSLLGSSSGATKANNYWAINTSLGQYNPYVSGGNAPDQYSGLITAAVVAQVGLGANLAADGTYPQLNVDSGNSPLNGSNAYSLAFSSGTPPIGTPPITANNGFWSVTVYDSNNNVFSSSANTYYYTSQVGGVYALGSIQLNNGSTALPTLYFQSGTPSDKSKLPFWIPVPSGPFTVLMRLYNPVAANVNTVNTILNPFVNASGVTSSKTISPPWIPPMMVNGLPI